LLIRRFSPETATAFSAFPEALAAGRSGKSHDAIGWAASPALRRRQSFGRRFRLRFRRVRRAAFARNGLLGFRVALRR